MNFQEKLQLLRREKGLSQENLAEIIGISRQAIAKWEGGKSYPDLKNLIQLSDLFKVNIDNLVRDEADACSLIGGHASESEIGSNLIEFLCTAKKATYAGKGAEVLPSRPNSHDLNYSEGDLKYIDTYIGGASFAGEEALWESDEPVWAMNYVGRILGDGFNGDFLNGLKDMKKFFITIKKCMNAIFMGAVLDSKLSLFLNGMIKKKKV